MDPEPAACASSGSRFPRTRGDGPDGYKPIHIDLKFPPHARGWTPKTMRFTGTGVVSPARAGMDLTFSRTSPVAGSFPRTRGDGPRRSSLSTGSALFPPHARGWTVPEAVADGVLQVSPARAGMDPYRRVRSPHVSRFPRTRGDGPSAPSPSRSATAFPPHARGWTLRTVAESVSNRVSPARAGMDPSRTRSTGARRCFPRTRGDGPEAEARMPRKREFPPHPRG